MTRKTSYTLREVANVLGLDYNLVRLHVQRKILLTTKKTLKANIGTLKKTMPRRLHVVSIASLQRYKKYICLRYKPRT